MHLQIHDCGKRSETYVADEVSTNSERRIHLNTILDKITVLIMISKIIAVRAPKSCSLLCVWWNVVVLFVRRWWWQWNMIEDIKQHFHFIRIHRSLLYEMFSFISFLGHIFCIKSFSSLLRLCEVGFKYRWTSKKVLGCNCHNDCHQRCLKKYYWQTFNECICIWHVYHSNRHEMDCPNLKSIPPSKLEDVVQYSPMYLIVHLHLTS